MKIRITNTFVVLFLIGIARCIEYVSDSSLAVYWLLSAIIFVLLKIADAL